MQTMVGLVVGLLLCSSGAVYAQTCDDFDECTGPGSCQMDGTCARGMPVENGTPCTHPISTCLQNPTCQDGTCSGGTPKTDGSSCKLIDSPCFSEGVCFTSPFPIPGFPASVCLDSLPITCPDDGDPCTVEVCLPIDGQCQSFPKCVSDLCTERTCLASGQCVETPRNAGVTCDDGLECTANTVCRNGQCLTASLPAASPTPTTTTPPTPTLTASATPTATRSPTPKATASPTAAGCFGDCNGDGRLTAGDVTKVIVIILSCPMDGCPVCPAADRNGNGIISAGELTLMINNLLIFPNGCAPPG